jgi:signal transduction histidine kinase
VTLRGKLILAQVPLVLALIVVGLAGGWFTSRLGMSSQRILADNYRSVLAAQRMNDALERIDSATLFVVAGKRELGLAQVNLHRPRFESELQVQESNITEPGEREATDKLKKAWANYRAHLAQYEDPAQDSGASAAYFDGLLPAFQVVREAADNVLTINQDAMVRKSELARRLADRSITLLAVVCLSGLALGIFASTSLTGRLLRPLSVLEQAVRRIGEGDLAARARVAGEDEIARVATEFNTMADRLQKYRDSSLGELLEAQRASQATIDSLPDPVFVISTAGALVHVNRAAEALLGIAVETSLSSVDPAARAVVERVHQHVIGGKGAYVPRGLSDATRLVTTEGERYFLPRAAPVYSEAGSITGTTLVLQDVSRLVTFEELRNNLVATVAHEFRTPLTSLRMAIHLLVEQMVGPLTEKQADLVYAAREDCERLQSIIDELLDLSRIQAGRIELQRSAAPVEALVKTALEAARGSAAARQVELRAEVLPGLGAVNADLDRVQLVFANLLANAVRYSPQGGAVVVRAKELGAKVRFEVSDTGPGIAREYRQAVFEKYFQVPGSAATGVGLGLFIAREVVVAHEGEIGVDSEPGKGATFWFTLPVAAPKAA